MNCDTGEIFKTSKSMGDFIKSIPLAERPVHGFVELSNNPVTGCERCKGTGIKEITPSGRRIPCACTNPK